jgi:hypothetical protein
MNQTAGCTEPSQDRTPQDEGRREKTGDDVRQEIHEALEFACSLGPPDVNPLALRLTGGMGLLRAIGSYEPKRGGPFLDYAKPLVEHHVRSWLRQRDGQTETHAPPASDQTSQHQGEPDDDPPPPFR